VTHSLSITYYSDKARHEEEFDLVVLATGARPPAAARDLASGLGFELNEYGFARTAEFTPVRTTRPGVYVAGAFRGPQDIPETVMTASAAAGEVGALLASGRGTEVRIKEYPPERDVAAEEPRVGVFICRCGINIASVVDVAAVVEYALSLPGVAHAQETLYTCSQDSLKGIREVVRDKGLNRVVVASCTIRTHQVLFRENMREAGLNQFLFEMANIRDQCSWVHKDDPAGATTKAQDLVRMAVAKVKRHRALSLEAVPVTQKALVIGGGIAGMTAALLLAEQGVGAYLVEREPALGGNLHRLYRTLDGGDVQALLERVTGRVAADRLIGTYLDTVIEEVSGHAGHFIATLSVGGAIERRQEKIEFGATIIATGAGELVPAEYLYGTSERVVTGLELEELLVSGAGRLQDMREVAFVQCVGSRQKDHDYCSRVCCAETVKNALELKKLNPRLRVYVLHRDMRTYGFMEGHYRRAREAGVVFIPFRDEEPPAVNDGPRWLEVAIRDRASGLDLTLRPDLLVLAAGTIPAPGTKELASLLKLPTNEDGFFLETHIKLGPMDFPSQGVFLCGAAHGPKFISEAVYQAQGAVARAMGILAKSELMVGGTVARVDKEKCAACLTCVRVCPFTVPRITAEHAAAIAAVECQGCGTCAAECPGRAIELGFYEGDQLKAKIGALFPEAAGS
jgi:heterodisulfide reductase subunit A-like polyferredoxin